MAVSKTTSQFAASQFATGIWLSIVTGLCWATLAIVLKYALHFASPGTIVWFRMLCAAILVNGYYLVFKPATLKKVFWPPPIGLVFAALFLSVNYFGYMQGLDFTSASNAQIMVQIGPLLLTLIGVFYFKEAMALVQWVGVAIAVTGFVLFDWDQVRIALASLQRYIKGNLWIAVGGACWAIFASIQKTSLQNSQPKKKWTPQETNLLIFTVCAIALLPLARFSELSITGSHALSAWQWFILVVLGVNTVIAYGSFAEAMQRIPASYVSLIITINPLITILLVALIAQFGLHFISPEPIHWRGYLGAGLVVTGVGTVVSLRGVSLRNRKPL